MVLVLEHNVLVMQKRSLVYITDMLVSFVTAWPETTRISNCTSYPAFPAQQLTYQQLVGQNENSRWKLRDQTICLIVKKEHSCCVAF